jgi:O-antigen ligase
MANTSNPRFFLAVFLIIYVLAFGFFYVKYVPLIRSFQAVFVPLLLLVLVSTAVDKKWGILSFLFLLPLINNLPYFFGVDENIPHAPAALVLFLVFFLGWLIHHLLSHAKIRLDSPLSKPLLLLSLLIFVSAIVTIWRFAAFFPFLADKIRDVVVNVNGVNAGGAIMSSVFNALNYLTGFLFFAVIQSSIEPGKFLKKMLTVLSVSVLLALCFSLFQLFRSPALGNTPFFVNLGRINATFKDPNSFGAFLSGFIPLALGYLLAARKPMVKWLFGAVVVFAFLVFPSSGSRSGLLALGVSLVGFFLLVLLRSRLDRKKKILYVSAFLLVLILVGSFFLVFFGETVLHKRVVWSLDALSGQESVKEVFTRKLDFWSVALKMIEEYPLTGVGVGSYIIELPNYLKQLKLPFHYTDSAENYFFQVGSELGLIGLAAFLWLFFVIAKSLWRKTKTYPYEQRERYILFGAAAGIVSLFVNFLFHSYIGNFEIVYFFWLLIAVFYGLDEESLTRHKKTASPGRFKFLVLVMVIVFGGFQLWHSTHSLSIQRRNQVIGWEQHFGFYQLEQDPSGFFFHWTKKTAGIAADNLGERMIIPLKASHPDLGENPVTVKIYEADSSFVKKKELGQIPFHDSEWMDYELSASRFPENRIYLIFETSRVWSPSKTLGTADPRLLGIGVGRVWFAYSAGIDGEKIAHIQKITQDRWEGEMGSELLRSGTSSMRFHAAGKESALRLNIGSQTALGIGPYVVVSVDDRVIGRTMLNEDGWTQLVFRPPLKQGWHTLSVEFTNAFYDPEQNQDRNLFLGDVEIITFQ